MSGEPVDTATLMRLFEAARWAPSSGNGQPWRFVYAIAGTEAFQTMLGLLVEANRTWCTRAGALIVVASKNTNDRGAPVRTHSFDAGAAWMSLALQGSALNLVVHAMAGFDYDAAASTLRIPAEYTVECMIAIGSHGRIEDLPDYQQAREKPSGRIPVTSWVAEGSFDSLLADSSAATAK